jgi:Rhodopirellula transposase DDE domain
MSPLRWTCKSTRNLAAELRRHGFQVSHTSVSSMLHALGYSLHALRKTREGTDHPDRNAQFEHINATVEHFQARNQPVISVDTKKKELVGRFKNAGREWQPKGQPEEVSVHDFPTDAVGKAIPYGVFDMSRNEAWVSVGRDHDTPAFAVASIRQWWKSGSGRLEWAQLLRRVEWVDVLACPCGGRRAIVADISDRNVVVAILAHLGLPTEAPPIARARSPAFAVRVNGNGSGRGRRRGRRREGGGVPRGRRARGSGLALG